VTSYTNAEKLHELEVELGYRERVFNRLVAEGRMTVQKRDRRMAILRDIIADYATLAERDEPRLMMGEKT
jgi:hypothetical protein